MGEDVIFLRKIVPGGADRSYGVAVAKLAGLPKSVIARARQIMARLEVDDQVKGSIGKSILDKRRVTNERQLGFDETSPDGAGGRDHRAGCGEHDADRGTEQAV